ncbi:50S ribosomal protein L4 [Candidatus Collierbacteria bacterium CG10_big_fil_rev_8_21_14_0_10_44_9]|uniref:Large ribosomal subunit protein uL4 n=1 Tax=Candidatus Collierbacteria bacterium CG10_big_fil_rev_8_21_14_0_10_44_9 TaxID=1974535 RepID=A0A2H0VJJ6_9BACT|nr:MAG: 50S ribosomal protein L4 [Candidatus Collierbacteria bacterium CG10_big_fil_rev_8_21_14_0_10_44_9]
MNIPVFDIKGQKLNPWRLEDGAFGTENTAILSQAVRIYLSNLHQKTHKVLTRGEVTGSTRKIYRQKGTGNARHGAKYAPIFVGGGIAHGPTGVRPENMILPKNMRRRALASGMQAKLAEGTVVGLAGLKEFSGKTSSAVKLLSTIATHPKNSVLILTSGKASSLYLAIQNLQGVSMKRAALVNAYDLVSSTQLIITKKALDNITARVKTSKGKRTV